MSRQSVGVTASLTSLSQSQFVLTPGCYLLHVVFAYASSDSLKFKDAFFTLLAFAGLSGK